MKNKARHLTIIITANKICLKDRNGMCAHSSYLPERHNQKESQERIMNSVMDMTC